MSWTRTIATRLAMILAIYLMMNGVIWYHAPQSFPDVTIWYYFWKSIFVEWEYILKHINEYERFVTDDTIISSIVGLVMIWGIICRKKSPMHEAYGNAKWASLSDLKKMHLNFKRGIVLGKFKSKLLFMNEPLSVLLLAPPGVGKSSGIAIPTLLKCRHSMIVNDPKGELHEITGKAREVFSEVIVFDPSGKKGSHVFNVFSKSMLQEDDGLQGYVENIATNVVTSEKFSNDFFVKAARKTFTFFALWMLWDDQGRDEVSIPAIRKKILEEENIKIIIRAMKEKKGCPNHIINAANEIIGHAQAKEQWAGVFGTLTNALNVFADPRVEKCTKGASSISAKELREQSTTIYLTIREKDIVRLAPLAKMFFETFGAQLLSEPMKEGQQKVTMLLDEFTFLGKLETLQRLPRMARSFGVNIMFIAQDYGDIIDLYGTTGVSSFKTNTAYKVIFRQNNEETAEQISRLIGNNTEERISENESKSTMATKPKNRSKTISSEGRPLLSAQDILNIPENKCIVIAQGNINKPVLCDIAFYYKDAQMKRQTRPKKNQEELNNETSNDDHQLAA